jgi:predicted DNA-binding protein with PD1-like motif
MVDEDLPSAMLCGFGFAGRITFGFFDFEAREYKPNSYENHEVTNLTGSLAWKARKTLPHLHATAGSSSFQAVGGHLLALKVGRGSMELHVTTLKTGSNGQPTRRLAPTSYNSVRPVEARLAALPRFNR